MSGTQFQRTPFWLSFLRLRRVRVTQHIRLHNFERKYPKVMAVLTDVLKSEQSGLRVYHFSYLVWCLKFTIVRWIRVVYNFPLYWYRHYDGEFQDCCVSPPDSLFLSCYCATFAAKAHRCSRANVMLYIERRVYLYVQAALIGATATWTRGAMRRPYFVYHMYGRRKFCKFQNSFFLLWSALSLHICV